MVKTKSVYHPREPQDGFRLLIMRRWPRGIPKAAVDEWEKELGPSLALLEDWRRQRIDWEQCSHRYREEMKDKTELIAAVVRRAEGETVTLLCGCRDESRCHRTLLKELITS